MTSRYRIPSAFLLAGLLLPFAAQGQSSLFIRFSPEASRLTVEHTKTVGSGGVANTSVSASTGTDFGANLTGGFRSRSASGLILGGEVELIVSAQRLIEGVIQPTPSGNPLPHVWAGRWEFSDRYSLGGSIQLGRGLGDGAAQVYLLLGTRRMSSEFVTGGTNPENGDAGEDRSILAHWPLMAGVGATLDRRLPVDLRLRYFRSSTGWVVTAPDIELDYDYAVSGLSFSVGIGTG